VWTERDLVEVKPQRSRRTVLHLLDIVVAQNQALGVGRGIKADPAMLNRALEAAQRLAPHDGIVVIISDFDGVDAATRGAVGALARHNDVIALLVHDPSQSELPPSGRMTVSDGELQISLDVGRDSMRKNVLEMSQARLRDVFAWTRDFGVPVVPLSTAEDPAQQIRHLLGRLPPRGRGGRGGGTRAGAAH